MKWAFILAFPLVGCSGSIELFSGLRGSQPVEIRAPQDQPEIVQVGSTTEVIEPPKAMCFARAAHFQGLVGVPCADIAQQTRP
jgi:hypothetical protein